MLATVPSTCAKSVSAPIDLVWINASSPYRSLQSYKRSVWAAVPGYVQYVLHLTCTTAVLCLSASSCMGHPCCGSASRCSDVLDRVRSMHVGRSSRQHGLAARRADSAGALLPGCQGPSRCGVHLQVLASPAEKSSGAPHTAVLAVRLLPVRESLL